MVLQTGGTVDLHAVTLTIGGYSPSLGQYTMTGGMLTNVGKITICASSNGVGSLSIGGTAAIGIQSGYDLVVDNSSYGVGTLQIVGAQASITPFNNFTHNKTGSTLDLLFSSDGITAMRPKYTSLGGTVKLGLNGSVALFRTNAFACIQAQNTISTDFATKTTSVFTSAASGTNYVATLDAAQKVTTKTLVNANQVLSFAPTNHGWFAVSLPTIGSATNFDLLLNVTTTASTPIAELDSLATNMALSGYTVTRISPTWTKPNMRVTLPTTTAGTTNFFAWDLTRFDANLAIGAIGNTARGTAILFR